MLSPPATSVDVFVGQRENDALSQKMREREAFLQEKLAFRSKRHQEIVAQLHSSIIKSEIHHESDDDIQ